ncbi:unnamed protein product [Meloidogyne enterolobii]|uniref:Uncharacterized protein n=1 Tax=Meloidogyne enterolobii TaxID=390850 RepID=A0ACB1AFQ6_MELEN
MKIYLYVETKLVSKSRFVPLSFKVPVLSPPFYVSETKFLFTQHDQKSQE